MPQSKNPEFFADRVLDDQSIDHVSGGLSSGTNLNFSTFSGSGSGLNKDDEEDQAD